MKILLCHDFYEQPGGEDQIFTTEAALLKARGHQVLEYTVHNQKIADMNPVRLAKATVWNPTTYQELSELLGQEKPQVVHFHNTFPLISPSAYYAARAKAVPVIQNLQNYRLLCPSATFLRDGHVCEDCLGKFIPWPGIMHACYRGSRTATAVVATMLTIHRGMRTWSEMVDIYTAPTAFAREKLIQGGLPAEKIIVKPNLIHPDPGVGPGNGDFALFVGRLAPEKGLDTLLAAWQQVGAKLNLKIVGDGLLAAQVAEAANRLTGVEWLGKLSNQQVLNLMKEACLLIFPSIWYEGLPIVIAEAYAVGLPVIGSNLGSISSVIDHGRTGLHFQPGNSTDLVTQVEWILAHPAKLCQMRQNARQEFETKYSAQQNYEALINIYKLAISNSEKCQKSI